jgi:hypothetical protein
VRRAAARDLITDIFAAHTHDEGEGARAAPAAPQ